MSDEILIVEDSPTQAQQLRMILEQMDFEVTAAANGLEALNRINERAPALVISDILMPEMGGYELCTRIKKEYPDIPVILVSTLSEPDEVIRGLKCGADNFLVKPYESELLLSRIKSYLELKSRERKGEPVEEPELSFAPNPGQVLNFLLSTYENAILQNRKLGETRMRLQALNTDLESKLQELQASEERFRTVVHTVPDIVYLIDQEGRFVFINDAISVLGYTPDELIGRHFSEIVRPAEIEDISRDRVLPRYTGRTTGPEGSPRLFDERRTGVRRTSGLEVGLLRKDGCGTVPGSMQGSVPETLTAEVNSSGLHESDPRTEGRLFVGTVGVIRDISERKRAERELEQYRNHLEELVEARTEELQAAHRKIKDSQAQLIQAEKMSALGLMSAGVAHELNNPMMGILNFSQYCLKHIPKENGKIPGILREIERETRRCIRIVRNLLTFSRMDKEGEEAFREESLDAIFKRVLGLLAYRVEKGKVSLVCETAECPVVSVKVNSIQQVFLNLLSNALDAVSEVEKREIRISCRKKGPWVEVRIADTGPGIAPENMKKIMDPFFTTKPPGKGTGLGLSVCQGIVEGHGGDIRFVSNPGEGTEVCVCLPFKNEAEELENEQEDSGHRR